MTSTSTITIHESAATSSAALALVDALSARLAAITGDAGRKNFQPDAVAARACFLLAMQGELAVGCGALRPLAAAGRDDIAEVKRMFAWREGCGIGSAVLRALEERARAFGYRIVMLETRAINRVAVAFYQRHGYVICENYGPYVGRQDAVCFSKVLA